MYFTCTGQRGAKLVFILNSLEVFDIFCNLYEIISKIVKPLFFNKKSGTKVIFFAVSAVR